MASPGTELHDREHGAFLDEVHSFEFWFQSVEGYLHDRPYGLDPADTVPELDDQERSALITTLCTYCIGETAALEGASGMIAFAPTRRAKIFLATQVVDEARHLEVFYHRLAELGVDEPEEAVAQHGHRALETFKQRLLQFVDARDWEAALFAQNVILESMEFAAFHSHMRRADARTAELLGGVLRDERRHMGFGENDLGRMLSSAPHVRARLAQIKRELDPLVLDTFEESQHALGVPRDERPDVGRLYLDTSARLGFDR